MESICVTRRTPKGTHNLIEHPIAEPVTPKPIPAKVLSAILERGDDSLSFLELDYWEIDSASLKSVMEKNVGLVGLRILLNEAFKTIVCPFTLCYCSAPHPIAISDVDHSLSTLANAGLEFHAHDSPSIANCLHQPTDQYPSLCAVHSIIQPPSRSSFHFTQEHDHCRCILGCRGSSLEGLASIAEEVAKDGGNCLVRQRRRWSMARQSRWDRIVGQS